MKCKSYAKRLASHLQAQNSFKYISWSSNVIDYDSEPASWWNNLPLCISCKVIMLLDHRRCVLELRDSLAPGDSTFVNNWELDETGGGQNFVSKILSALHTISLSNPWKFVNMFFFGKITPNSAKILRYSLLRIVYLFVRVWHLSDK